MGVLSRRGRPPHPDVLTPAEWEVLDLVRHGMRNRQIAEARWTSLDAVKFHIANLLLKLEAGDRAELRSWVGAPVNSAIHARRNPMANGTHLGHIGQISREVSDIESAVAFFRDVVRLPHLFTFGNLAFFDCDGTRLFLSPPEDGGPTKAQSVLYFTVDDIFQAVDELAGRGAVFHGAPHMIHRHENGVEEWMAFFQDPDGGLLALMSQVAPPEE
jgi:DNA-binding CsgD family transcriptional regulator/predicted enzyme related to lactoylglutathione lyase